MRHRESASDLAISSRGERGVLSLPADGDDPIVNERMSCRRADPGDVQGPDVTDLPAYHSVEEILSHPRFPIARDEYVRAILALYEHKPLLNRLLLEAGRSVLFIMIICLNARYDEADRATWPTRRLVMDMTVAHGISSRRRLESLISQFIDRGYVETRAWSRDRRVSILTPTAKMLAHDHDWLVAHHLPLEILFPQPGYPRIMQRDPSF